jgi:hypothetical protein
MGTFEESHPLTKDDMAQKLAGIVVDLSQVPFNKIRGGGLGPSPTCHRHLTVEGTKLFQGTRRIFPTVNAI